MKTKTRSQLLSCCVLMTLGLAAEAQNTTIATSRTDTQPLNQALSTFAKQTGLQLIYVSDVAEGRFAKPIPTGLPPSEALERILEGTGLEYEFINERTVRIYARAALRSTSASDQESETPLSTPMTARAGFTRVAAAELTTSNASTSLEKDEQAHSSASVRLEEVVVTGSHIRGVENLSSPVIRFEREEIEKGGFATTQQLMQSLPQNLNSISDASTGNFNGGPDRGASYDGSGVNLRGLGGEATLLLVNGRRMAAAGKGAFVDISLIPLSAIERVDVLTDGASAIYGSDAVGGVVNLILRNDFEGAETRVRYGAVTEGNHDELQAGQMVGHAWENGHALVSYEYFRRSELDGSDRDFFDPTVSPYYSDFQLIPEQERHGGLVMLNQRLSDRIDVSADFHYGQRDSAFGMVMMDTPYRYLSNVQQYGGSLGVSMDLARDWQVRFTSLLDQNDSELQYILLLPGGPDNTLYGNESRLWSADLAADGSLMSVPGGEVRLAVGSQARRERFVEDDVRFAAQLEREVAAVYAEVNIPWVSEQNRRTGIEHLELTLAARYEDYSDFGGTFNPKLGLAFAPLRGLNVRGTWGTSFKAPLLDELNPGNRYAMVMSGYHVGEPGPTLTLAGNGENLGAQKATNWTVGFDFSPLSVPELSFSSTYFDIDYDDRISAPLPSGYDSSGVLLDPTYAQLVTRNADPARVTSLIDGARHQLCYDYVLDGWCDIAQYANQVRAIVDQRPRNLAGVAMSGVDFSLSYRLASAIGDWGLNFRGTQLFKHRQQLIPGGPQTSEMNDVWRPVDLRLRNTVSFSRDGLSVVAAVSYTDDYRDRRPELDTGGSVQRSTVASWTTVDLNVQYEIDRPRSLDWVDKVSLQFNVLNLLDRNPPYVASNVGLYYDGVNANPLGRFISAQFTAQWGRR